MPSDLYWRVSNDVLTKRLADNMGQTFEPTHVTRQAEPLNWVRLRYRGVAQLSVHGIPVSIGQGCHGRGRLTISAGQTNKQQEYTHVDTGMHGSPVYHKILRALPQKWGQ